MNLQLFGDKIVSVWSPQPGPQDDYCCCPLPEVFVGGARGGGKTSGVLGKWALKERRYGEHFNAIMLRPSTISTEDAVEVAKSIYEPLGGQFRDHPPRFRMPHGGRVRFSYLESIKDADEYQGRNVTDACVEEAGLYPRPDPIMRIFGVLRSSHGVPIQLTLTANPGGAGQQWIRERYDLVPFPRRPKVLRRRLPDGSEHLVGVIPSRITDNKILLENDPGYVSRLHLVGSAQLVKAWLEGDWTAIEGAFFGEWSNEQHVIAPFAVPDHWLRFRSGDWGSYSPFSFGWWAVVSDDFNLSAISGMGAAAGMGSISYQQGTTGRSLILPRGAMVRYREYYGQQGGKLTAEQVAYGLVQRERSDPKLGYGVLDPATFTEDGGPSIAERINAVLIAERMMAFRPADNARVTRDPNKGGAMGGWDMMRQRLIGTAKRLDNGAIDWSSGRPMIYFFSTCKDSIRTIPVLQHDPNRSEDLDTDAEDHAADDVRYGCMSRPWIKQITKDGGQQSSGYAPVARSQNPYSSVLTQ